MSNHIIHAVMYRDYKLGTICDSNAWGPPTLFTMVVEKVTCPGCRTTLDGVSTGNVQAMRAPVPAPPLTIDFVAVEAALRQAAAEVNRAASDLRRQIRDASTKARLRP
jgi:hypothetical protein